MARPNTWQFDPSNLTLALYDSRGLAYEVNLEQCTTSAEALDWIAQVATKLWATDMIIADLVRALNDLLDLQANMCGMGQSSLVNVTEVVQGRSVRPVEEVIGDDTQPELRTW
jgi:hypothetical protein